MSDEVLQVLADGNSLCVVHQNDLPFQKAFDLDIQKGSSIILRTPDRADHVHALDYEEGLIKLSIAVTEKKICMAWVQTESKGKEPGLMVVLQPLIPTDTRGLGLISRLFHRPGYVTPRYTSHSCICDACGKNFRLHSYHCGFSNANYFYSESGKYTMIVRDDISGCPKVWEAPDAVLLKELEAKLPKAKDGTAFLYDAPYRCPHCSIEYIDFKKHPEQRLREYYCYTLFDEIPESYPELYWGD